jgi:hypothetical protein
MPVGFEHRFGGRLLFLRNGLFRLPRVDLSRSFSNRRRAGQAIVYGFADLRGTAFVAESGAAYSDKLFEFIVSQVFICDTGINPSLYTARESVVYSLAL